MIKRFLKLRIIIHQTRYNLFFLIYFGHNVKKKNNIYWKFNFFSSRRKIPKHPHQHLDLLCQRMMTFLKY